MLWKFHFSMKTLLYQTLSAGVVVRSLGRQQCDVSHFFSAFPAFSHRGMQYQVAKKQLQMGQNSNKNGPEGNSNLVTLVTQGPSGLVTLVTQCIAPMYETSAARSSPALGSISDPRNAPECCQLGQHTAPSVAPNNALLYSAVQYRTLQCSAVERSAVHQSTVQWR